jgi:hypothetical protein
MKMILSVSFKVFSVSSDASNMFKLFLQLNIMDGWQLHNLAYVNVLN